MTASSGRGATNPPPSDGGQGDTAENPPTTLTARLVVAAESEIATYCIHTDPVDEGCDCAIQARAAVVAVLRELAAPHLDDVRTGEEQVTQVWTDFGLAALADEIDANTTHQENP